MASHRPVVVSVLLLPTLSFNDTFNGYCMYTTQSNINKRGISLTFSNAQNIQSFISGNYFTEYVSCDSHIYMW
jgi:hypothetical protein